MSELIRYVNGEQRPALFDRKVAKQAKGVYDAVRLAGMHAEGSAALAAHIMKQVVELDAHRVALAGNDPVLNQLLLEVEATAVQQSKAIQSGLYRNWSL